MQIKWLQGMRRFAHLVFIFITLLLWTSNSYAERVNILNSATSTASGAGSAGMASLTGFNIPTGDNRALMIVVAFERDHCDKVTDNCTSTNTGLTGDLADNFAYESGDYNSGNVQVTARVQAGTNTITKKNALLLSGLPSGDLRFTLNRKELKNASNVVIANTTYFSLETYTIVFYESELKTVLNGTSSGLVDIAFPTVPLPKSTGDDMIVAAYIFDNVKQNNRGIVRANAGVYTPTTGAIAGNYTLTTPNFDAGDTLVHMNDSFIVVGVSSLGYPASKGGFNLINSYYREIHTATTTNNQGRFDTVFSTGSQEPDGMSLTTQRYNANYDGLGTNYAIQSAGLSTDRLNALNVASYVIYSHNRDTSDAQEDYPIAQHDVVGVRLGNLVDEDWGSYLGYNPRAMADDLDGVDDEDGVTFPATITPNSTITAAVNVQNGSGYLNAWIDWNRDADFDDVGERLATEMPVNTGVVNLSIAVPALVPPETFARFRVCSAVGQCNTPAGIATSGEVEDHVVSFNDPKPLPNVAGTTAGACSPTGGADVLFVLDNSGSIDPTEYANFASNVVNVGNQLLATNSETRIAVAHYGGVYRSNEFGQHVYFERDFSKANVTAPIRQFGLGGATNSKLISDNLAGAIHQMAYGLDNNPATDSVFVLSGLRSLSRDLSKPLQVVIFTDAWRYVDYGTALIDGAGFAFEPDDGSSFTIFNKLKAQGIKFTVVLYPDGDVNALPAAAAIASKGGSYNGTVEANTADPEGSGTPRRLVEATTTFTLTPAQIGDIAGVIANTCPAAPNNPPVITSNGGGDNAYLSITENTTVVTTVTATDADSDTLTYSLNGGVDAAKFTISASTGVLAFTSAPSFNNPQDIGGNNIYEVRVQVSDNRGGVDNQLVSVAVLESQVCLPIPATSVVNASISAANEYILTQSLQGQRGALWGNNRINLNASFDYRAKVYLGNDSAGADGMTFTLQPLGNNVIGQAGRGLGSGDGWDGPSGKGLDPSLVIELDTHTNLEPNWYDPAQDHIAVYSNGNTRHNGTATDLVSPISLGNISDGRYHDFRVAWNAATKTLQVYFDNTLYASKVIDLVSTLGTATPYWGYTASTGAQFNLHKVCNKTDPSMPSNYIPVITSNGGGATASISLNENSLNVTTVTATDADNDTLTYSISGGVDAVKFTINASTGVLQFIAPPDFELPSDADSNNSYIVQVKVVDGKGGEDQQTLTINIVDQVDVVGVRARAFLQGAYESDLSLMHDTLRSTNILPLSQPYTMSPFNYQGTEVTTPTRLAVTGTTAVVDWVLVELHSANSPATIVARKAALLTRGGDIIDASTGQTLLSFNNVDSAQSYYVAVKHRNHLGVMNSAPVNLDVSNNVLIDFTAPTTTTYGGANTRMTSGVVSLMWAGDANRSQLVIANGPDNDPMSVLNAALLSTGNVFINSNYIVYGYSTNDLDLNGYSLFAGPNNDLNIVISNILMHPANNTRSSNYVLNSGMPR